MSSSLRSPGALTTGSLGRPTDTPIGLLRAADEGRGATARMGVGSDPGINSCPESFRFMLSIPPSRGAPVNHPVTDPNLVLTEQLTDKLGIEITEWEPKRLVGTMPVAGNRQPYGLLHGGASAAFAETLG